MCHKKDCSLPRLLADLLQQVFKNVFQIFRPAFAVQNFILLKCLTACNIGSSLLQTPVASQTFVMLLVSYRWRSTSPWGSATAYPGFICSLQRLNKEGSWKGTTGLAMNISQIGFLSFSNFGTFMWHWCGIVYIWLSNHVHKEVTFWIRQQEVQVDVIIFIGSAYKSLLMPGINCLHFALPPLVLLSLGCTRCSHRCTLAPCSSWC